jgi:hypothetical protein
MRRRVVDLETWPEPGSLRPKDRDLLELLRLLSAEAGQPDSGEAVLAYYRIRREIGALKGRKLRDERLAQHDKVAKGIRQRQRGTEDWHVVLVRTEAYELGIGQRRRGQEEATQLARRHFVDEQARRVVRKKADLRPVERRAVAILGGAPRNAKKSVLEKRAITLADAVIAEWFSPRGKRGRPAGSKRKLVGKNRKLPSVAEVIKAILPIIEQLAGPKASSSPKSTMIKAIASAVESSADLKCTVELAADAVRKRRPTSGPSTT